MDKISIMGLLKKCKTIDEVNIIIEIHNRNKAIKTLPDPKTMTKQIRKTRSKKYKVKFNDRRRKSRIVLASNKEAAIRFVQNNYTTAGFSLKKIKM